MWLVGYWKAATQEDIASCWTTYLFFLFLLFVTITFPVVAYSHRPRCNLFVFIPYIFQIFVFYYLLVCKSALRLLLISRKSRALNLWKYSVLAPDIWSSQNRTTRVNVLGDNKIFKMMWNVADTNTKPLEGFFFSQFYLDDGKDLYWTGTINRSSIGIRRSIRSKMANEW